MSSDLDPEGWPTRYDRVVLEAVDSTLDEAQRRLPDISGPTWILALQQTAARGRRGRAWHMPEGNFAATLVLPDAQSPLRAAQRSFVASLALYDVFKELGGWRLQCVLKWPNDVLLNGGKIAGILLEGLPNSGVAIGVGVNLAAAPGLDAVEPGAVPPTALVKEIGKSIEPSRFLHHLACAYDLWEMRFMSEGFEPVRNAWLSRAARLGEVITARLPNETISGTFETLDEEGQLILRTPLGGRRIAAGDIFF